MGSVTRFVPVIASTMAALTTVFSFLFTNGMISFGRHRPSALRASWIKVAPTVDTAHALGDTIHLAATIVDKNGAILLGTQPTWTSESPNVARVDVDGSVIARSPGSTTIIAAVDDRTARVRVVVRQRVASMRAGPDSAVTIAEGENKRVMPVVLDPRGHIVRDALPFWTSDDTSIATIDSLGVVTARNLGQTSVHATIAGLSATHVITVAGKPASIETVDGDAQHSPAGTALSRPVVIRVLSRLGRPIEGVAVKFLGAEAQGSADPSVDTTDAQGQARTRWMLGSLPGEQRLVASVDGIDSSRTLTAEADPVAENTVIAEVADNVAARAGTLIDAPVGIRVTDAAGRLLAGIPVTWATLDGGSVQPSTMRTDSAGEARVQWTLGTRAGTQRLRARVGSGRSVPPVTVAATALPGEPRTVTVVSGNDQTGRVGSELSRAVILRVVDSAGNPVTDAPIVLAPSAGSVADSVVQTDSSGRASVRWKLGRTAGSLTLGARLAAHTKASRSKSSTVTSSAVASARALPGSAETLTLESVSARSKTSTVARTITATVMDVFGNPIPDAVVRFVAKGGTVSPASAVSDAKGRAKTTWKPLPKRSSGEVSATVRGGTAKETLSVVASQR